MASSPSRSHALAVASIIIFSSSHASADDRIAVEALEPAPMQRGAVLSVFGARALAPRSYTFSVVGSYADKPLTLERAGSGSELGSLAGSIGTLSFMAAVGLADRFDVGVALPVHRVAEATSLGAGVPSSVNAMRVSSSALALGDIRIVPRYSLLRRDEQAGFGLAVLAQVYLPTGNDNVYAGEAFRAEPRLALDWRSRGGLLLAFNLGYLFRAEANLLGRRVDDMLRAGVGADVPFGKGISGLLEVGTGLNVLSSKFDRSDAPTEGFLGLRYRNTGWTAQLGGGPGLIRGLTSPSFRASAALSFTGVPASRPASNAIEADDCSDPADTRCAQPLLAPDPDHDHVLGAADQCVETAEDIDDFEDADGCPDPDNDADGVDDATDRCPTSAEDRDGYQDDDGCPDLDNDLDGIADAQDRCPLESGLAANSGCLPAAPMPPAAAVQVTERAIELHESIFFARNSDRIEQRSTPLLDEIANVLKAHSEILQVVIEGHTDDRGRPAVNRKVSQRRATAVLLALEARGIDPRRLGTEGFGSDRPIVPNDTDEQRAQNRRVELRIEARAP